jgi:hypothetical protein
MDNLSVSDHFNNLIGQIHSRITNSNIDDQVYSDWMIKAKRSIVLDLQQQYKSMVDFYNNSNLFIPNIIVESELKLYSIKFDKRWDHKKIKSLLEEFIKIDLGFNNFNLCLVDDFFSICIEFNKETMETESKQLKLT